MALSPALAVDGAAQETDVVARGEYIFNAAGCASCHTDFKNDGEPLAGGRALKTPFGTFYGPNISPDPTHGIGAWTDEDFVRALREGVGPAGQHYYPVFPYTAFTRMSEEDILALKAYIFAQPPVASPSEDHDIRFPFGARVLLGAWKRLNFTAGSLPSDPALPEPVNRGAYLVEALTHCGECHTPRTRLGGLNRAFHMAGAVDGPEGELTPNITPHEETGIGAWSRGDMTFLLRTGINPDGDVVGSLMGEVVEHSTSKLTNEDLAAIAAYLETLPAIDNEIKEPQDE